MQFEAQLEQRQITAQGGWLPDWWSDTATFQLLLKNASNIFQQSGIQLQGKDSKRFALAVLAVLSP